MTTQHTPGPWYFEAGYAPHDQGLVSSEATGQSLATTYSDDGGFNARLIAAAPDMLAALVALFENCAMVHKHWGDGSNQKEATAAINAGFAAIDKATGGVA